MKYAEVIKAAVDGKPIEVRRLTGDWRQVRLEYALYTAMKTAATVNPVITVIAESPLKSSRMTVFPAY